MLKVDPEEWFIASEGELAAFIISPTEVPYIFMTFVSKDVIQNEFVKSPIKIREWIVTHHNCAER